MRSLLILITVLAFGYSSELKLGHRINSDGLLLSQQRVLEDTINETLNCIRYNLENGLPEFNFSSVETLSVEDFFLDVDNLNISSASGYAHVRDLTFTGLTSFFAPEITGSISLVPVGYRLDILLVFQNFDLKTLYDLEMVVDGMHVFGDGDLTWNMEDLSLRLGLFVSIGTQITITDLSILVHIGSSHAEFTGWFNDEEHSDMFTYLFNDYLVPAWVNQQPEDINEALSPILEELINSLLTSQGERLELTEGFLEALMTCPEEGVTV